ncbi:hypothetical protein Tco_0842516 [Tanacetum coccineum]|uniref:Integrase, catalytic region, zinc finger, CCHC-type, peptidase aspartic, catalytic n=1 Tax=Tanacetum coccineum TaxID=301880 RepID=A0ABQ5B3U1_9ASTR
MMKGSDIGIQEKKVKLFNEWERFTSTDGESIESYYHRFSKLMNDFKRNKHFPEKIATDYTQLYDFLKYNQKEVDELRAERLAKTQDPLVLMANSNNPFNYPVFHPDLPSSSRLLSRNVGNQNEVIVVPGIANQNGNGNVVAAWAEGNANGNNEAGIQLQAEEFDLMVAATDLDEIEESDKAPVYDSDGSAEVQLNDNCYNDEIFNMFTQEEQYTELLEPIPKPHQVPQNDRNVISEVSSIEQGGGTLEQHPATVKETRAYQEPLFHNLVAKVEKVNSLNRKMKETNDELTTELARYKNQLQAQLGDQKGKCKDTPCVSDTLDSLPRKLENENIELEFQNKLHDIIYENAKLRAQLFDKVSEQKDTTKGVDITTKTRRPQPRSNIKNYKVPSAYMV